MRVSSFSVVLSFIVLMIIGAAMIPLVDVGDQPVAQNDNVIMIRTEWPNTSAKVVEEKVTSPLEGMVSAIKGVKSVSSNSFFGKSEIDVTLKRNTDVASAKFEMASLIRQTFDKLPQGVLYPWIGGGYEKGQHGSGNENELLLTYQIASNMPSGMIKNYVEQKIVSPLTKIQGVNKVEVMGVPDRYIEIDYDPEALMTYGLSANDLASAIRNFMGVDNVVGDVLYNDPNGTKTVVALHLVTAEFSKSLEQMPIKKLGDKIVYLNDLASFQYKVEEPDSYFRINGMNTIYLNVYVPSGSKLIPLSSKVRNKIEEIKGSTEKVQKINSFDAAKDQRVELKKLVIQTLSSIAILLLFVWITNRSWKNLLIVAVSLVANLLISVIGYVLFHVQLNAYSLAGITVALGLVIDSTIVMADHYGYYHDRKAFLSILAALLTTIGSLLIIFFLPQETRDILIDFGWVIIINLSTSLLIALLFVPALIDQLHYIKNKNQLRFKSGILLWNRFYTRYIMLVGKHRVICCILLVLAFGIPIFALPDKLGESETDNMVYDDTNLNWGQKLYNSTLGSDFFFRYCKEPLSKYLGGSMYLFHESLNDIENKKNDEEKKLYIQGQMPAGSSASQLNEKVIILENYLKGFKQIKEFITNINENKADIEVSFKDAYKNGPFPYQLEDEVIAKLIAIGGADWSTSGISPEGFSNSINLKERNQQIEVTGYNYDQLYRYAENICDYLKRNDRVIDLSIETPGYENQEDEFYMKYNPWAISIYNMPPEKLYDPLSQMLKDNDLGFYSDTQISSDVKLSPVLRQGLDVWHLNNAQVNAAGVPVNISEFMDINKREAKNIIPRKNQEYVLSVAFNLLGSFDYISDYMDRAITHINKQLPVGFKCKMQEGQFEEKEGQKYGLLVLIAVIIYFICSIHFESLRIPLAILLMIPVSLIGTFLTFYFTHIPFGDGGYASLVMLNGVTVNSAIYVISQYLYQKRMPQNRTKNRVKIFVSAYNHKIIPVMLTISSTIFGLIPFFFDGTDESFWFSFAIGVSGGLLFSILAFIFVIPIFLKLKE